MSAFFFVVCVPREEHEMTIRKRILDRNSNINLKQDALKTSVDVITELPERETIQNKSNLNLKSDYSNNLPKLISTDNNLSKSCYNKNIVHCEAGEGSLGEVKNDKNRFTVTRTKIDDLITVDNSSKGISESDTKESSGVYKKNSPKKDIKDKQKNVAGGKPEKLMDAQTPLETVMTEVLQRLNIKDAVWCPGRENKYYQVFFSLDSGAACEEALQLLGAWGVGTRYRSALSVIPCALHYSAVRASTPAPPLQDAADAPDYENHDDDELDHSVTELSTWRRFVLSIKARLTVAQVAELVRADASLTFDWLFLLLVAAFAAVIGLVENSAMFLVASMLISPLMGPIMAGTFGTAIRDRSLQLMGVLHEMFGLLLAMLVGFFFGLLKCLVEADFGGETWPTTEMLSRCEIRSLWVGALVAVPSGAAVAIALLGDNTASLVGVAISASLLPPAVNAGLLWALAIMPMIHDGMLLPSHLRDPTDLAIKGAVSLALTLVNIVCVYLGGLLVYKIKEVSPITSEQYWRYETSEQPARAPTTSVDDTDKEDQWPKSRWRVVEEVMRAAGGGQHATWSAAPLDHHTSRPRAVAADLEAYFRARRAHFDHATPARPRNLQTHRNLLHLHGGLSRHSICVQSNIHQMPTCALGAISKPGHERARLRSNSQVFPTPLPGPSLEHFLDNMAAAQSKRRGSRIPTRSRSSSLFDHERGEDFFGGRYVFNDFDAMSRLDESADSGTVIGPTSSQSSRSNSIVGGTAVLTNALSDIGRSSKFKRSSIDKYEYTSGKC